MDFRSYPENIRMLVRHARGLLREWLPGAKETDDSSARLFGYGYGPGYRGTICPLILSKSGAKLGIPGGASLTDPHNLLRGAGKVHRHVPLKAAEDHQQPGGEGTRDRCERRLPRTSGQGRPFFRPGPRDTPAPQGLNPPEEMQCGPVCAAPSVNNDSAFPERWRLNSQRAQEHVSLPPMVNLVVDAV